MWRRSKNAAGNYIAPTVAGFVAAADAFLKVNGTTFSVNSTGVEIHIVNAPKSASQAYPLSTYSNIIFRTATPFASEIRHIVYWVLTRGDKEDGPALLFAPSLPSKVLSADERRSTSSPVRPPAASDHLVAPLPRPG